MSAAEGLDTNVVVAATVGPADRLWPRWNHYSQGAPGSDRFVPSSVVDEFYAVTEGVGRSEPGLVSQLVTDAVTAIRLGGSTRPTTSMLRAAKIDGNRLQKVDLLLNDFVARIGGWDQATARGLLRQFEKEYAHRKAAFFRDHPVESGYDEVRCGTTAARLQSLGLGSGASWLRDCVILSQVDHILRSRPAGAGVFVTEDVHHIGRNASAISKITSITAIFDLGGARY